MPEDSDRRRVLVTGTTARFLFAPMAYSLRGFSPPAKARIHDGSPHWTRFELLPPWTTSLRFMKRPADRTVTTSQATPGVEGYVFDGVDGSQMAVWTCKQTAPSAAHAHDYDEYMVGVQGTYTLIIDERRIAGDEYLRDYPFDKPNNSLDSSSAKPRNWSSRCSGPCPAG